MGRFRGVLGFRVEIASGELLDSDIVEEGDEEEVRVEVEGDLMISRSSVYAALPPPLKQELIVVGYYTIKQSQFNRNSRLIERRRENLTS